jgi:hypothetical protein
MDLSSFVALAFGGFIMLSLRLGNIMLKYVAMKLGVEESGAGDTVDEALAVASSIKTTHKG